MKSPLAAAVVAKISELYAIEAETRGPTWRAPATEAGRNEVDPLSRPCMPDCRIISASSDLAKAIRYAIRHWSGLTVSLRTAVSIGHERGRTSHQAEYSHALKRTVRGQRWRSRALDDRDDTDPDSEAELHQSNGLPGQRA
jgi:hypothetical protein